jgi:hypothetical protein
LLFGLLLTSLAVTSCSIFRQGQQSPSGQREITLVARNQNFYDATLYAIGPGGSRQRLGRVSGNSDETFSFRWSSMELRIEIDLLSVGSTFTDALPIDEGDELELIITPDLHRRIPLALTWNRRLSGPESLTRDPALDIWCPRCKMV